jgi:dihydrofolate reductase
LKQSDFSNTEVISSDLSASISAIKERPGPEILVFGSPSATHALMSEGLIDGFWLFINPVVLGQGIPLFKEVPTSLSLTLVSPPKAFACGVTEHNYLVERS